MWPFSRKDEARSGGIENPSVPLSSEAIINVLNFGGISEAGINVNFRTAMQAAPVWAAVNFISKSIASLPLNVYDRVGEDRTVSTDPVQKLLHDSPNPETTSYDWRKRLMTDTLLTGRHVSLIVKARNGRLREILPLDPTRVKVSIRNGKKIYRYGDTDGQYEYAASEVIDLPWSLEFDGFTHRDPMQYLKNPVGLYLALESYASKFFQNGGVPPLQLVGPTTTVAGAQRASEDITRAIAKAATEQRNILTMPMGHELKPIGIEPEKMQMESARLYQLGEIARIFDLPRVFLQDMSGATYSNVEQQDLNFVKHTLTAWIKSIEQELNLKLFPTGGRFAEFNVNGLLRGDFKTRMEGYRSAVQSAIMTPNEIRTRENLPAKDNADDLLIQGATVPLGSQTMLEDVADDAEKGL